jgi:hypothetical protein
MGIEGAGGGVIGERYARVWSGGDGAGATWKQALWRGDLVLPAMMAAVGALQRGVWVAVVHCKGGVWGGGWRWDTRAGGTGELWGQ